MKTTDRQKLLDDLLPAERAPGIDSVLAALRQDRATRATHRTAAGIMAATLLCLFVAVLATRPHDLTKNLTGNLAASPTPTASTEIPRLSDEELQAAIDRPSAIVTLPDGRKSLLVLVPPPARVHR